MARLIFINVDTTLNQIQVTDSDTTSGEVFLDYFGKIGNPVRIERSEVLVLTDADAQISIQTQLGETGFFKFADIDDVQIDGVTIGAADLADVLTGIGAYLFTSIGGSASSTMTFNYASGNQYKSFHRIGFVGEITAANLTNVTSYTIYQNGALITPLVFPVVLAQNDTFYVEVTATNTANPAAIELEVDGITTPVTFASGTTYMPKGHYNLQNLVAFPNFHLNSDASVRGNGLVTNDVHGVIWDTPIIGDFEILFRPSGWLTIENTNSVYGLNDLSGTLTPAPRLNRIRYGISTITYNSFRVYEGGVIRTTVSPTIFQWQWGKIEVIAGTVKYYYSTDDGATWVLVYTSLSAYNGTTPLYADWCPRTLKYIECHPPMFTQL